MWKYLYEYRIEAAWAASTVLAQSVSGEATVQCHYKYQTSPIYRNIEISTCPAQLLYAPRPGSDLWF